MKKLNVLLMLFMILMSVNVLGLDNFSTISTGNFNYDIPTSIGASYTIVNSLTYNNSISATQPFYFASSLTVYDGPSTAECKITIDGVSVASTSRTLTANTYGNIALVTPANTLALGEHIINTECRKSVGNNFVVENSQLSEFLLYDTNSNSTITYLTFEDMGPISLNTTDSFLGSFDFNTSDTSTTTNSNFLVTQGVVSYNYDVDDNITTYFVIEQTGETCGPYTRGGNAGSVGSIGASCLFSDLQSDKPYTLSLYGYTEVGTGSLTNLYSNLYEIQVEENSASISSLQTDLTNTGLVSSYEFDSNLLDSVGSNDGTASGYTLDDGTINGAIVNDTGMYFDGVDDSIDINSFYPTWNISKPLTFNANIYATENNNYDTIFEIATLISGQESFLGIQNKLGTLVSAINDGSTYFLKQSTSMPLNRFFKLSVVYNVTTIKMYVDGVEVTGTVTPLLSDSAGVILGGRTDKNSITFFNGTINNVQIFNRALSINEVLSYNNTGLYGLSPVSDGLVLQYNTNTKNSYDATTVYDMEQYVSDGGYDPVYDSGKAFRFDGIDDYISLPLTENLIRTISFDLNPNEIIDYDRPFAFYGSSSNRFYGDLRTFDSGTIRFYNDIDNINQQLGFSPTLDLINGNHLDIVDDGSNFIFYLDGIMYENTSYTKGFSDINSMNTYFGDYDTTGSRAYNGAISNIKIYDEALSPERILNNYNSQKTLEDVTLNPATLTKIRSLNISNVLGGNYNIFSQASIMVNSDTSQDAYFYLSNSVNTSRFYRTLSDDNKNGNIVIQNVFSESGTGNKEVSLYGYCPSGCTISGGSINSFISDASTVSDGLFTITAYDSYSKIVLNNFNVSIGNNFYSTTIGSVEAFGSGNQEVNISAYDYNPYSEIHDTTINLNASLILNNKPPLPVSVYGECVDSTVGTNSNTNFTINMSLTSDPNGNNFTHDVYLKNLFNSYLIKSDLPQYTTVETFTYNKNNLINSEYSIIVKTTDTTGLSVTNESVCTFNLCVSNWVKNTGSCINDTQLITYTDSNSCSISYDVPSTNNTYVACDDHIYTDSEAEIHKTLLMILFLVFVGFIFLQILNINNVITISVGLLNVIVIASLFYYMKEIYVVIPVVLLIFQTIIFFVSIKTMRE